MRWMLAILIIATAALCIYLRDLSPLAALPFALGCLLAAWLCERRLPAGRSQGVSAAVFGVVANVVGAGLNIPLAALPYGSTFDSLRLLWLVIGLSGLVAVVGVALSLRGLVRARGLWKLPSLAGSALSLTPIFVSHQVYLWAVEAGGLRDLW